MKTKVDVCIIGAAGAGMSAALKAVQFGAQQVLILEKMPTYGGCTKMAGGIFGIESPVQARMGLPYYDPDVCFKDLMGVLNWQCNTQLVHNWLSGAGENIRWLEELGVPFTRAIPFTGDPEKVRSTHHVVADTKTGLAIAEALHTAIEKEPKIQLLLKTRALELLQNEHGRVCGVKAEGPDGEFTVEAGAVVLATGSISSNQELLSRFYNSDEYADVRIMAKVPHNTGDGLRMAEQVGARTDRISTLYIGPHNHFPGASEAAGNIMRRPQLVKFDRNGYRFVDESIRVNSNFPWMIGVCLDRLPGKVCYAMCDSAYLEYALRERKAYSYVEERFSRWDKYPGEWFDRLPGEILSEQEAGRALVAQSFDEVADWIGADREEFRRNMDRYNRYCTEGHDSEFTKDPAYLIPVTKPPFYVFKGPTGIDTVIGGLKIDHSLRVLNHEDHPIPGLYAAGVVASGWLAHNYGFYGSEMSFTIYSGRTAGEKAAKYATRL